MYRMHAHDVPNSNSNERGSGRPCAFLPSLESVIPGANDHVLPFQFVGIKKSSKRETGTENYVNTCMVNWSLGRRPFRLLHHIPSPTEV